MVLRRVGCARLVLAFGALAVVCLLAIPAQALAAGHNITIEANGGVSTGGSWSGGTFTSTSDSAVLDVSDLESHLAAGQVSVDTGPGGSQAGGITVASPINDSSCGGCGGLTLQGYGVQIISSDITLSSYLTVAGGSVALNGAAITTAGTLTTTGPLTVLSNSSLASSSSFAYAVQLSSSVDLGQQALTISGNGSIDGLISGTGGLVESGTGTLILAATNSYSGGTTVNSGTLEVGAPGAIPANSRLDDNGTIDLAGNSLQSDCLSGSGAITNSHGGLPVAYTIKASVPCAFSGSITGNVALNVSSIQMFLSGSDSYTGGTTVSGGLVAASPTALPPGTDLTMQKGTLELAGQSISLGTLTGTGGYIDSSTGPQATVTVHNSGSNAFAGGLSGNLSLDVQGSGTLALSAQQGYSGPTSIAGVTVELDTPDALSSSAGLDVSAGGTIDLTGNSQQIAALTGAGTVRNSSTTEAALTIRNSSPDTVDGVIAGNLGLTLYGTAPVTVSGSANTFSGATAAMGGATLQLGTDNALPTGTALTDNGKLDLAGHSQELARITSLGSVINSATSSSTLTIDDSNADQYGGPLIGNVALIKSGPGTLTLTGKSSYSGGSTIRAGTLTVNGTIGDVVLDGGGLAGNGGVGAIAMREGGGTINPGDGSPGVLHATAATLGPVGTFATTLAAPSPGSGYAQLITAGPVTLGGASLSVAVAPGFVPAIGESFTILESSAAAGLVGTFAGLPQGTILGASGYRFQITYSAQGSAVTLTRVKNASTIALAESRVTGVYGTPVTLTARVEPSQPGLVPPSGTVVFADGSSALANTPLSRDTATVEITSLLPGVHYLTAVYRGDNQYAPSISATFVYQVTTLPLLRSMREPATTRHSGQVIIDSGVLANCPPGGSSCQLRLLGKTQVPIKTRGARAHQQVFTVANCRSTLAPGRSVDFSCALNRRGRTLLRSRGSILVELTIIAAPEHANGAKLKRAFRVSARRR